MAREADRNAREVISHVVEEGLWPSYVLVVQVLLQRYGIHDLSQLQLSAPLPALLLLLDVNAKVDLFLGAYLAIPRGICTLVDLERDASAVLRSFSVPSLRLSLPAVAAGPKLCDQNEIVIDNDVDVDVNVGGDGVGGGGVVACEGPCTSELDPLSFEWFGLGPLHRHPRVSALFSLSSEHVLLPPTQRLSSACVMRTLLAFRRQTSAPPLSAASLGSRCIAAAVALDWAAFSAYLLQTHRISSLASAGVLLLGSGVSSVDGCGLEPGFGAAEIVMLRQVEQAAGRAMVQATKRQLENLQRGGASGVGVRGESLGLGGHTESVEGPWDDPVAANSKRQRAAATAIVAPDSERDHNRDRECDTQPQSSASAIVPFAARLLQRFDTSSGGSIPQEELRVGHFGPEVLSPLCSLTSWAVGASGNAVAATNTSGQGHDVTHGADVLRAVGRWGEALVYNFLLLQHPDATVEWVNRDAETRAPYDLILTLPPPATLMKGREATTTVPNASAAGSITVFVEVKSTRFSDLNVFDLSLSEWDFATRDTATRFHLYRVFNAGNPAAVRLARVQDVRRSVEAGTVRLCLAV